MKRLLIMSAFLVASAQLQASHLASELSLRLQHQAWFTLSLDNQFFETPVNFFHANELTPGNHFITVTRLDKGYYGPFTHPVTVYKGYIFIPALSKVHAMIDKFGQLRINNITPIAPVCYPVPVVNECAPVPYAFGMNDYDFQQLVSTINHMSFESSKMQGVKQALSSNQVTARQVEQLMQMMTFESSKLELAKFAYHRTIDKQNYYLLNDSFTFESSIQDLNDFIYRS